MEPPLDDPQRKLVRIARTACATVGLLLRFFLLVGHEGIVSYRRLDAIPIPDEDAGSCMGKTPGYNKKKNKHKNSPPLPPLVVQGNEKAAANTDATAPDTHGNGGQVFIIHYSLEKERYVWG